MKLSLKSTSQDFSTRRDSIIPDLFMEWDMRCIRTLIRVPEYSRDMPRDLQRKREEQRNLSCTDQLNRYQEDCSAARRRSGKPISANVDFYSGFVYSMLGIPIELFTPIFAIARIAGWSAHRIEELVNAGKIIRPAYKYVGTHREYLPMEDR